MLRMHEHLLNIDVYNLLLPLCKNLWAERNV